MPEQKMTYQERVEKSAYSMQQSVWRTAGFTPNMDRYMPAAREQVASQAEAIREVYDYIFGDRSDIDPDIYLLEHGYIEPKTDQDEPR